MQHLKTKELVSKLTNLWLLLVPLLNQEAMELLVDIERRPDGGKPAKPLGEKKISEKEQNLQKWYHRLKSNSTFHLPLYDEWRPEHVKFRREEVGKGERQQVSF